MSFIETSFVSMMSFPLVVIFKIWTFLLLFYSFHRRWCIANWMFSYLAVHIYKNYDVRLVDGVEGSFEGRVEVYRVGSWGTICDDEWGLRDANVVCKQLGYASAINAHGKSYFGEGTGRIWLDDLACMGNETNIGQCLHRGWGSHDCTHKQDAGVVCDKGKVDAFQHFIICHQGA